MTDIDLDAIRERHARVGSGRTTAADQDDLIDNVVPALIGEVERLLDENVRLIRARYAQPSEIQRVQDALARVRSLCERRTSTGERWIMVPTDDVLAALDGDA